MNVDDDTLAPAYQLRRATLEDLPGLRRLWAAERLPASELDKRFTEFQVALYPEGQLAGAMGIQVFEQQGLVHSEAFANHAEAGEIRPLLWQRILTVARNNGLIRLWALPVTSFYREQGMTDADEVTRAKLPDSFGNFHADWVTLKLKEENPTATSLEKEFEVFALTQRSESERVIERAKAFRILAYGLLILVLAGLALLAVIFSRLRKPR